MKIQVLCLSASILAVAFAACPFQQMKRSGQLSEEDVAKFEAVKRDPKMAEILFEGYQKERRAAAQEAAPEAAPELAPRGLIGPINGTGGLDLPFGGGLLNGKLQKLTGALQAIDIPTPQPQGLKQIPGSDPAHQFRAPGPTDIRGVCPTLNALANHGYISRSGVSSFAELADGVQTGFGFGFGLSVFLSALGLMAGGDLVTGKYTIAGADPRVPNTIGPAGGLDKHGVFEIDGSITRQDVHFGNNANFLLQRWNEYVAESKQFKGLFGPQTNAVDNGFRYDNSIKTNPDFLAGVAWFAVSHAERVFVYEGLANGTTPGVATYQAVAPFFLNETFPKNWYRRGTPLSLAQAFQEAGALFLLNPRALGGNEGVGNFIPLGIDLTKKTPSQIGCFILENILDNAPDQLDPLIYNNYELYTGFIKGVIAPFFIGDGYFNCNAALNFVKPGQSAGQTPNGKSSSGSPVNGAYPGIGVIAPDSQPS